MKVEILHKYDLLCALLAVQGSQAIAIFCLTIAMDHVSKQ